MELKIIIDLVQGTALTALDNLQQQVSGACSADLMSDVLASIQPNAVLLTGLCNPQVVRTAQMADVRAIIFVRGKIPAAETVQLAEQEDLPLITSPLGMFEMSGRLYQAGLPSLETPVL